MKDNLFVACGKFQHARDFDRGTNPPKQRLLTFEEAFLTQHVQWTLTDNLDILLFWGDTLVVIARDFDLPLFELAIDKYEQARRFVSITSGAS
jgi:hypothetical protein